VHLLVLMEFVILLTIVQSCILLLLLTLCTTFVKFAVSKMTVFMEENFTFFQDYGRCNFPITHTKYVKVQGVFIDRLFVVSLTSLHTF